MGNSEVAVVTPPGSARPPRAAHLGDFTLRPRTVAITVIALAVGGASAVAAFCLLRLIGLTPTPSSTSGSRSR